MFGGKSEESVKKGKKEVNPSAVKGRVFRLKKVSVIYAIFIQALKDKTSRKKDEEKNKKVVKSNEKVLEEAQKKLNNIKKKSAEKQKLKVRVKSSFVNISFIIFETTLNKLKFVQNFQKNYCIEMILVKK